MIGWREYRRLTEAKVRGRKVRALEEMVNGTARIPAGAILTVRRKHKGYDLESLKCGTCHLSVFINRVNPTALAWALEDDEGDRLAATRRGQLIDAGLAAARAQMR